LDAWNRVFGSLAIIGLMPLDPWLCVAGFRRVCLCRYGFIKCGSTYLPE